MNHRFVRYSILIGILLAAAALSGLALARARSSEQALIRGAVGTGFLYQGRLDQAGVPANGSFDFNFGLYDAPAGGTQIDVTYTVPLSVSGGLFNAFLDFGPAAFDGTPRFLAIGVRPSGGGSFTALTPRQSIAPAPYAIYADHSDWNGLANIPGDIADGDQVDDADPDPSNEIQELLWDGATLSLTLGANKVDLGSLAPVARPDRLNWPQPNEIYNLAASNNGDEVTSITIGSDGLPVISYFDLSNGGLTVAHCSDLSCSGAVYNTVDDGGLEIVGKDSSIAIGADGLPFISYYNYTKGDLVAAHCLSPDCSTAITTTVDFTGSVGSDTSVAIGTDGMPVISYFGGPADLKVAHCLDLDCSTANLNTVDSGGNVGQYSSIAVGPDGLPVISYYDATNFNLKIAHCNNLDCSTAAITSVVSASQDGLDTSIAIGVDGLPIISHYDIALGYLKVVHCNSPDCSSLDNYIADNIYDVGGFSSITIGFDGLPVIVYYDYSNKDLKMANCVDLACSSAVVRTIDGPDMVGAYAAITIGVDGLPVISYYDQTNSDLKVAHCSNPFCAPFFRRR